MSGKWTKLWDDERQKWVSVYIDLPAARPYRGTGTTAYGEPTEPPKLLGPDGKVLEGPARRIGFRP